MRTRAAHAAFPRHSTARHSTAWGHSLLRPGGCTCFKGNFGTAEAHSSHARHRPPARLSAGLPCPSRAHGVSPPAAYGSAGHRGTDLCRCRGCSSSFWKQTKQKESIAWLWRPPCPGEGDRRPGSAGGVLASSSLPPVLPVARGSRSGTRGHGVGAALHTVRLSAGIGRSPRMEAAPACAVSCVALAAGLAMPNATPAPIAQPGRRQHRSSGGVSGDLGWHCPRRWVRQGRMNLRPSLAVLQRLEEAAAPLWCRAPMWHRMMVGTEDGAHGTAGESVPCTGACSRWGPAQSGRIWQGPAGSGRRVAGLGAPHALVEESCVVGKPRLGGARRLTGRAAARSDSSTSVRVLIAPDSCGEAGKVNSLAAATGPAGAPAALSWLRAAALGLASTAAETWRAQPIFWA